MAEIIFKELSHQVMGCVFDVFREIGPGFDEFTYHQGLKVVFNKRGLPFQSKPHIFLHYQNFEIAELELDFIIDEKIILELKAIQTKFLPENYSQIISYLHAMKKRLGILINFGLHKAFFDRVPFDEKPIKVFEDFKELNTIMRDNKSKIWQLQECIMNVANELRLGYHVRIYQEAIKIELKLREFSYSEQVKVPVNYQKVFLNNFEIDYWLIDDKILFAVLAGSKDIRAYDVMRMRSYLKKLKLDVGLIAYWSNYYIKIIGVSSMH